MTIHLHWGWATKGGHGTGAALLKGVSKGFAVCGARDIPREKLAAFPVDADCPACLTKIAPGAASGASGLSLV